VVRFTANLTKTAVSQHFGFSVRNRGFRCVTAGYFSTTHISDQVAYRHTVLFNLPRGRHGWSVISWLLCGNRRRFCVCVCVSYCDRILLNITMRCDNYHCWRVCIICTRVVLMVADCSWSTIVLFVGDFLSSYIDIRRFVVFRFYRFDILTFPRFTGSRFNNLRRFFWRKELNSRLMCK